MPQLIVPFGSADWAGRCSSHDRRRGGAVVILADLVLPRRTRRASAIALGIVGLVIAGVVALQGWHHPYVAFGGAFIEGGFAIVFEGIVIVAAIFSLLMAYGLARDDQIGGAIALDVVERNRRDADGRCCEPDDDLPRARTVCRSRCTVCAGLRAAPSARESALKYLILSSTASGFLLYGMALLFGATGSVALAALGASADLGGAVRYRLRHVFGRAML